MSSSQPPSHPPEQKPDPPSGDTPVPPQGTPIDPTVVQPGAAIPLTQLIARGLPYAGGPFPGQVFIPTIGQPQVQLQLWQGQFPPPEAMERYEKILPGSFDRMIKMAEKLQDAQITQTTNAQNYTRIDARRGHWLGFSTTVLALLGAIGCGITGAAWGALGLYALAALMVGVPVMAVAKALVESVRSPSPSDIIKAVGAEQKAPQVPPITADQPPAPKAT
jgi:uncharacterized membrane protein